MAQLNRTQSLQLLADLGVRSLAEINDDWLNTFFPQTYRDPIKLNAWNTLANILREHDPVGYKKLTANKGMFLELQGWEPWLRRMGALTFTREFAPIQRRFWDWNWNCLIKIRQGLSLEPHELVGFLPWPRETGKSSSVEWACIQEGALLKTGYVIILCSKQTQAEEHVVAIRDRIEKEHVAEIYPWLNKPKMGAHGNKFGWSRDFLLTSGGWAVRPVGADVAIRGGKTLDLRPTLIVPDDYDEIGDSPMVVEHKMHVLTRTVLPMGNEKTRVLVPQNPIHANSCINQMLTGASLALARKTVFGEMEEDGTMSNRPLPAIKNYAYEVRQSDSGPYSVITQGESNWPGISLQAWEATLNRVSPEAFDAEYQHNMAVRAEERMLPEYDDRVLRVHVITWSQFEAKYGHRRIPSDWPCDVGLDIGFTEKHKSAWTFLTKVPQGSVLSGSIFRYRGRSFTGVEIGEQAIEVRSEMWPDEQIQRQLMSHEGKSERLTLSQKHGWFFQNCESGKEDGVSQWRHFLKRDRTQPHPFHRDEKDVSVLWKLGRPAWFDIVDDLQFYAPVDDKGMKRHRDSAFNWKRVPIKLTDKGFTVDQPAKIFDDEADSTRMLTVAFGPIEQTMTAAQRLQALIPAGYHAAELAQRLDPNTAQMTGELATFLAKKTLQNRRPALVDQFGQRV